MHWLDMQIMHAWNIPHGALACTQQFGNNTGVILLAIQYGVDEKALLDLDSPFSGVVDNVCSLLHLNHEAAGVGFNAV